MERVCPLAMRITVAAPVSSVMRRCVMWDVAHWEDTLFDIAGRLEPTALGIDVADRHAG